MSYLEVICGELQHVPENITDDLCLPLKNHTLIVQRLYDFGLHLKQKIRTLDQQHACMFLYQRSH